MRLRTCDSPSKKGILPDEKTVNAFVIKDDRPVMPKSYPEDMNATNGQSGRPKSVETVNPPEIATVRRCGSPGWQAF